MIILRCNIPTMSIAHRFTHLKTFQFHANTTQLLKHVEPDCLPTTYGGVIPLQDMIDYTKELVSNQRKKVLGHADMELLSTRGIISSRSKNNDINSVQGSFRKLEID